MHIFGLYLLTVIFMDSCWGSFANAMENRLNWIKNSGWFGSFFYKQKPNQALVFCTPVVAVCCLQWQEGQGGNCPPKFWAVGKFFLSENFCWKIKNLGWKPHILGKFRGKIEIFSTHNLLLQLSVRKLQLPALPIFLTDSATGCL